MKNIKIIILFLLVIVLIFIYKNLYNEYATRRSRQQKRKLQQNIKNLILPKPKINWQDGYDIGKKEGNEISLKEYYDYGLQQGWLAANAVKEKKVTNNKDKLFSEETSTNDYKNLVRYIRLEPTIPTNITNKNNWIDGWNQGFNEGKNDKKFIFNSFNDGFNIGWDFFNKNKSLYETLTEKAYTKPPTTTTPPK